MTGRCPSSVDEGDSPSTDDGRRKPPREDTKLVYVGKKIAKLICRHTNTNTSLRRSDQPLILLRQCLELAPDLRVFMPKTLFHFFLRLSICAISKCLVAEGPSPCCCPTFNVSWRAGEPKITWTMDIEKKYQQEQG